MSNLILKEGTEHTSHWSTAFKVFAWISIVGSVAIFIAWTCDSAKFTELLEAIGATIFLFAMSALFRAISEIMDHLANHDKTE